MDEKNWKEIFATIQKREDNNFIQFLMDAGLDVNTLKDKNGKTMLSYAAECGNLENIEYLVQKGADGNVKNSDGSIPLHIAAKCGHKDIVKFFLNSGIFVDSCDNDKCTPLHYAAAKRKIPLAARGSYQELVHFLIDNKADLNAVNQDGSTPLLFAAQNSRKHIVELLIKLGADVEYCDKNKWTVLHHSSCNGWSRIVRTLVEGKFDIDLNARNSRAETPLMMAARYSHKDIVQLLIDSGADVKCHILNRKLLQLACTNGWLDVLKSLLAKGGCDLNAIHFRGETPLAMAARYSHSSVVECLIESGADAILCNIHELTYLHHVCREGWLNVVKCLIKKGFDINALDAFHNTPLHFAVMGSNLKIIEHLLKAGADCYVKNDEGKTALNEFIQGRPCLEGVILFIENGVYIQPKDYVVISAITFLKEGVLQDMKLCTQAVINEFNSVALPKIYKIPVLSERLPSIEKMKIANNTNVVQNIAQSVKHEIQIKGCCNIFNVRHGALSILSVRSLIKHFVS